MRLVIYTSCILLAGAINPSYGAYLREDWGLWLLAASILFAYLDLKEHKK